MAVAVSVAVGLDQTKGASPAAPTDDHTLSTSDDHTLSTSDAVNVLDELLEGQNHHYVLGLKLKLPVHVVDSICATYPQPRHRLLQILIEFMKQVEPRPTWRVIVHALKTPAINLPQLAKKLEAAHCPQACTSTRAREEGKPSPANINAVAASAVAELPKKDDVSAGMATSNSLTLSSAAASDTNVDSPDFVQSSQPIPDVTESLPTKAVSVIERQVSLSSGEMTCDYVQAKIKQFQKRFHELKNGTRENLEKDGITVKRVADSLTSLAADDEDEHKHFLESHVSVLFNASNHSELFGTMNFHWNCLNYQLLDHLIEEFDLGVVKDEMETYKKDLQRFREKTPLALFCHAQRRRRVKPTVEFRELVAEFDWPDEVMLEDVEQFRQEYAYHYSLRACAMMLAVVRRGSFIVTWFIPESIVEKLKAKVPRVILKNFLVTTLKIAGVCVYRLRKNQAPTMSLTTTAEPSSGATATTDVPAASEASSSWTEQEYHFVEQPPDDFYCPVTYGLLLKPHLTACCGKHLSEEAATRIQQTRGKCPLCNTPSMNTMLSKHFLRQVNELRVFCHHEDRGCAWQGELCEWERHVQSCPMCDTPLMSELLKLPVYDRNSEDFTEYQLTLQCQALDPAPCGMSRGSATNDDQFAYFTSAGSTALYRYNLNEKKWEEYAECPCHDCALVIIAGGLTSVGGRLGEYYTNKLFTLHEDPMTWTEDYPPMIRERSHAAVVSTSDGRYLFVIGGGCQGWSTSVELCNLRSRQWFILTNLPHPLSSPSATLCGGRVHVIGYDGDGYSCSLSALPNSDSPNVAPSTLHWRTVLHVPVSASTAAALHGQLVVVGGSGGFSSVNSIRQLVYGEWMEIGWMSTPRWECLVVSPSPDKMLVVGGWRGGERLASVEECAL